MNILMDFSNRRLCLSEKGFDAVTEDQSERGESERDSRNKVKWIEKQNKRPLKY